MSSQAPHSGSITTAAAAWPDVERLFGVRGEPSRCWCRFFALTGPEYAGTTPAVRKSQLKEKFDDGAPAPGVLAFRGGEPVGWCAVEPRNCYPRIIRSQVMKAAGPEISGGSGSGSGSAEPSGSVWSVSCFVVAAGHRRTGVAGALLGAAVEHASGHGATVVEGYPVDASQRPKAGAADLYHGTLKLFLAAGFEVVSNSVTGRAVVRLNVPGRPGQAMGQQPAGSSRPG